MGIMEFHYDPKKDNPEDFAEKMCEVLYPEGEKFCMMDCKFTTGYEDGSGAECNNPSCPDYQVRVRSWDTVSGCPFFEEGERILNRYIGEV